MPHDHRLTPSVTKTSDPIPSLRAPRELLSPKRNLIPEQDLCRRALPPPVPACGDHERARGVEVQLRDDACAVARDDEEGCGGGVLLAVCAEGGGGGVVEVVLAEDVVGGAVEGVLDGLRGSFGDGGASGTYHINVRPLGMARTALTGPLTLGNLKVREGSERVLWRLYSSTVPLRLGLLVTGLWEGSGGGALTALHRCSCRLGSSRRSYTMAGYLVGVAVEPRAKAAAGPRWRASRRWRRRKRWIRRRGGGKAFL
jgi:hypothetical protein